MIYAYITIVLVFIATFIVFLQTVSKTAQQKVKKIKTFGEGISLVQYSIAFLSLYLHNETLFWIFASSMFFVGILLLIVEKLSFHSVVTVAWSFVVVGILFTALKDQSTFSPLLFVLWFLIFIISIVYESQVDKPKETSKAE